MGKVKKFPGLKVKKITGGKDPKRLVEDFIVRMGFDPEECLKENSTDSGRWMLTLGEDEELEVLAEALSKPSEATVYFGVNVAIVPLRGAQEVLVSALEVADGLVGIKVSLVGHFLVLSATLGLAGCTLEDLEYHYRLILAQQDWFRGALIEDLGWEEVDVES